MNFEVSFFQELLKKSKKNTCIRQYLVSLPILVVSGFISTMSDGDTKKS